MASDKVEFRRALEKWDELHKQQEYSVPQHLGRTAIICSGTSFFKGDVGQLHIRNFTFEGRKLAVKFKLRGLRTELITKADSVDMERVLTDPSISNVITIGDGSLSYIFMNTYVPAPDTADPYIDAVFSWVDAADASDHLKTGYFEQRQCGHFSLDLSVPLGMFVMQRHSNVYAPVGKFFSPTRWNADFNEKEEQKIQQATPMDRMTYKAVKKAFPKAYTLEPSQEESTV